MRFNTERLPQYLAAVGDLVVLTCSWCIAFVFISRGHTLQGTANPLIWHQWRILLTDVLALWIPIAVSLHIYSSIGFQYIGAQFLRALQAVLLVVSTAVVTALLFTNLNIEIGREFITRFIPISGLGLYLARRLVPRAVEYVTTKWPLKPSVAVITDVVNPDFFDRLQMSRETIFKGIIVPAGSRVNGKPHPLPVLGTTGELAALINRERLDRIVLMNGSLSQEELQACNSVSRRMGVTMSWALAIPEPDPRIQFSVKFGMHVLEIPPVSLTRGQRLVKRIFDVVIASALLVVLFPLITLVALLVKLGSDGPILYRAARVGRGGRYFTFLKFRTMYANSDRQRVQNVNEKDGHLFKIRNDPRVTGIGRILRQYSLDELPQLINVLAGDMSLIGPRPLPVEDLDPDGLSSRFAVWSEQRASVPPGITGLWQIKGRSELPFSDLVKYDLEYVHNWSLAFDLKILLRTPFVVFARKGAY